MKLLPSLMTAAALLAAAAAQAQVKWDLPAAYPASNFHSVTLTEFAADVDKATGGKLDEDAFAGEAKGVENGKDRGLQVVYEDPNFLVDLAQKRVLTMAADGVELGTFDLAGSGEAVKSVLACQAAQG